MENIMRYYRYLYHSEQTDFRDNKRPSSVRTRLNIPHVGNQPPSTSTDDAPYYSFHLSPLYLFSCIGTCLVPTVRPTQLSECVEFLPLSQSVSKPMLNGMYDLTFSSTKSSALVACRWFLILIITNIHTYIHTYIRSFTRMYVCKSWFVPRGRFWNAWGICILACGGRLATY
ncbi:hypothetical protein ASPFODRAFT_626247 [Aspergillus luchuensis CBS 106.47]|uniref:Uncharacterized protein n=1 Tax=Aspergillus luchuensis (strain CBS 106.47) TaxID=1137211 RepID=A0A1M3TG24_ASPLC|nr:hypothetical protein ASPFODRAFT_626247 [Aspergillus luchuensis CBS 106.47]